ncbi:unnamed protein product [Arabis nemorensis]|uniref:Uncharacterized protein n=1 Tax=Arabis nemorensis TaxID=586526 RepID=A0A565AYU4_9BRAS|nr:unnamed protein product [Arabis nemorensis]
MKDLMRDSPKVHKKRRKRVRGRVIKTLQHQTPPHPRVLQRDAAAEQREEAAVQQNAASLPTVPQDPMAQRPVLRRSTRTQQNVVPPPTVPQNPIAQQPVLRRSTRTPSDPSTWKDKRVYYNGQAEGTRGWFEGFLMGKRSGVGT